MCVSIWCLQNTKFNNKKTGDKKMTVFYEDLKEALTHAKKEYLENYEGVPESLHVKHLVEVEKGKVIARRWAVVFFSGNAVLLDFTAFLLDGVPKEEFEDLGLLEKNVLHSWLDEWNDWEDEDGYYHNQWELPAEKKNYIDL